MYIRELKNRSGSISIQIISKVNGKYKVVKTIGSASTLQKISELKIKARQEMEELQGWQPLFESHEDRLIEHLVSSLTNSNIRTIGPELIFGKVYEHIGFGALKEDMFRHLVISRLAFPLSKLKTVDYLFRYQRTVLDIDAVYRFHDKLNSKLKDQVEQIAFNHTKRVLKGKISVVFYDMTTLYFEASDEDDLRKTGFSKDGKHQNPQIFIGLLVGLGGYAIAYDIYEGNIYEGHTLIPFIEMISKKFLLDKPVIVADAGLLSNNNIKALKQKGYEYIIGARIKNEIEKIKTQILHPKYDNGETRSIIKSNQDRLIINYSSTRAAKDAYNRERGINRLEKRIKAGKLNKSNINNRGYNKYLKLNGEISVEIDYQKYYNDQVWDGLKGYITNTKLDNKSVIENYKNLWHIEKAFRMSKTDLRVRPVYHRLKQRIEAHICISFTAYCIYKELERVLYQEKSKLSIKRATELTHNMYDITYTLPKSKHIKTKLLKMDEEQKELFDIIQKYFGVLQR
jgi:transposase